MDGDWYWLLGAALGFGFLSGAAFSSWSNNNYLVLKAAREWRTAACIRGKFYYIVPESEYNRMSYVSRSMEIPNCDSRNA